MIIVSFPSEPLIYMMNRMALIRDRFLERVG